MSLFLCCECHWTLWWFEIVVYYSCLHVSHYALFLFLCSEKCSVNAYDNKFSDLPKLKLVFPELFSVLFIVLIRSDLKTRFSFFFFTVLMIPLSSVLNLLYGLFVLSGVITKGISCASRLGFLMLWRKYEWYMSWNKS